MEALTLQILVSLMLAAGGVLLFLFSGKWRDVEHADRLALLPIEEETAQPRPARTACARQSNFAACRQRRADDPLALNPSRKELRKSSWPQQPQPRRNRRRACGCVTIRCSGRVVDESPERIVLVTVAGVRLELPRAQVESIRLSSGRAVDGTYWAEDPNSTRLFFTSTARPLRKGDGYISSFMLFLPLVAYGVTDRFTLAGGTPILPEAIGRVWYFAPKYTVMQRERSAFALGALGFVLPEDVVDNGSIGIMYGAGTWGSRDRAITAGAGWGYIWASGTSGVSNHPVVMLGGEQRVSRRVKLITRTGSSPAATTRDS